MTSWPWMKNVPYGWNTNPIDPVCDDDDRLSVQELVDEHYDKIQKIKAGIEDDPLYDATKHDELFILRFHLSHNKKSTKKAIDAIKYTLKFRQEHNLDDEDIRDWTIHRMPSGTRIGKNWERLDKCIFYTLPDERRGVVAFIHVGKMDPVSEVKYLTKDDFLYNFMICNEWTFQWQDYVTRTTGRMTKSMRVLDLSGWGMHLLHRESYKRSGWAMKIMEDCYPQMVEKLYICNPPTWMDVVWKFLYPVFPKRILMKMDIIHYDDERENSKAGRRRFWTYISKDNLPIEFGGNNSITPRDWIVPAIPNTSPEDSSMTASSDN